jgi:hypothetical protein
MKTVWTGGLGNRAVDENDRVFYEELGMELRHTRWALEHMATKRTLLKREDTCGFDVVVVVHRALGHGVECKFCSDPAST